MISKYGARVKQYVDSLEFNIRKDIKKFTPLMVFKYLQENLRGIERVFDGKSYLVQKSYEPPPDYAKQLRDYSTRVDFLLALGINQQKQDQSSKNSKNPELKLLNQSNPAKRENDTYNLYTAIKHYLESLNKRSSFPGLHDTFRRMRSAYNGMTNQYSEAVPYDPLNKKRKPDSVYNFGENQADEVAFVYPLNVMSARERSSGTKQKNLNPLTGLRGLENIINN